jgi:tetrahydromethanopterin S-methyltransferase subunit B
MDMTYISRLEFEEYSKRMEDEHTRQNHRISKLEDIAEQNHKLILSVEKIATNVENMQKEQTAQRESIDGLSTDLDNLKNRDGEKWRKAGELLLAAIIGGVITFLFKTLGM